MRDARGKKKCQRALGVLPEKIPTPSLEKRREPMRPLDLPVEDPLPGSPDCLGRAFPGETEARLCSGHSCPRAGPVCPGSSALNHASRTTPDPKIQGPSVLSLTRLHPWTSACHFSSSMLPPLAARRAATTPRSAKDQNEGRKERRKRKVSKNERLQTGAKSAAAFRNFLGLE